MLGGGDGEQQQEGSDDTEEVYKLRDAEKGHDSLCPAWGLLLQLPCYWRS